MFFNYLKLAIRLLIRNPFFSLINVLGLSVGFAVFFILWQYTEHELKSDRQWKDWQRMKRLTVNIKFEDAEGNFSATNPFLCKIFSERLPELSEYVRICAQNDFRALFTGDHDKELFLSRRLVNGERLAFLERKLMYADPNLFTFFSIPLAAGDAGSVLLQPSAVVLSERLATKYFGGEDPIGKMLLINDSIPLTVTGVFKNLPGNSHLDFEAVLSTRRIEQNISAIDFSKDAWFRVYYKLPAGADEVSITDKIDKLNKELSAKQYEKWGWQSWTVTHRLQPIEETAFTMLQRDSFRPKSKTTLQIFQWIAIVVLVLAWINYINLSLASHQRRTKEVATRRALGAQARQFVAQFFIEACLINILAIAVALTIFQILRNSIQLIFGFSIAGPGDWTASSFVWIGIIVIGGIMMSGLYPALIIINRSPRSLFASLKLTSSENGIARFLTTAQFIIAITLVAWMFAINSQVKYILNKDLGFSKDQVVVVDLPYMQSKTFATNLDVFKQQLEKIPGVVDYATSSSVAGDRDPNGVGLQKTTASAFTGVATNGGVDDHFIPFYKIKLVAGRNFLPANKADENSIILSRKALQLVGYSVDEGIGQRILVEQGAWTHHMVWANIIGVIEDYEHQPLLKGFQGYWNNNRGMALTYGSNLDRENSSRKLSVKIDGADFHTTLDKIKQVYDHTFHGNLFAWSFLDDNLNQHYENEKTTGNQILLFTGVATAIACLGLLGMISNRVVEKTKEIGIRKVLGAELHQIAKILLNTTMKQVILAILIGIPVAYYLTNQYLEKFSDRITLGWWHFALPVALLIIIMFGTIASVLWKAAHSNPVEALKCE